MRSEVSRREALSLAHFEGATLRNKKYKEHPPTGGFHVNSMSAVNTIFYRDKPVRQHAQ
jgi:hypothetical protein